MERLQRINYQRQQELESAALHQKHMDRTKAIENWHNSKGFAEYKNRVTNVSRLSQMSTTSYQESFP